MIALGVANSSPLIGLERIGEWNLLGAQFERLVVPPAVAREVGDLPPLIVVQPLPGREALAAFPPPSGPRPNYPSCGPDPTPTPTPAPEK